MKLILCVFLFLAGCSSKELVSDTDRLMAFKGGHIGEMPCLLVMYSSLNSASIDKILFYSPNAVLIIVAYEENGEWFMRDVKTGAITPMGKLPDVPEPKPPPKGAES